MTHVHVVGKPAPNSQHLKHLGQYASSPGHKGTVVQNLPFSSLAVAMAIATTHYTYPPRDGQAELAWLVGLSVNMVYPQTVAHADTNRAQHRATTLNKTNKLPLVPNRCLYNE